MARAVNKRTGKRSTVTRWTGWSVCTLFILLACHVGQSDAQMLVLEYEFDNVGNLGQDTSGLGNDGNIVGSVTPVAGIYGAGSTGAYLNEGAITRGPLAGYTGLPGFTFSAWVNVQADNSWDGIISQDSGGCCEHRFLLHSSTNMPYINVHQHSDRHIGQPVQTGQWTHLVMTGQNVGGSAEGRVYINGVEVTGSPQIFAAMPTSATFNTYIGRGDGGTSHGINAYFDGVQIYEGALNAQQIANIGGSQWGVDANGDWNTPGSWIGNNVPNGTDATANFYGAITADRNVNVATDISVGTLNFDNAAASYNVGGAGKITLTTSDGMAEINVLSGSHTISSDISLGNSDLIVNADGNLHISGNIPVPQLANLENLGTGTHSFSADGEVFNAHVDNDGSSSWLLVGRGRQGWDMDTDGQGTTADVSQNIGTPAGFLPAAYRDAIVNGLLADAGLDLTDVEIRLRRAANPTGTAWQEVRWNGFTQTAFTFDFDSNLAVEHTIQPSVLSGAFFDATSNTFDTLQSVGTDSGNNGTRVFTWGWGSHAGQQGFSYGSSVANGANNGTSFLWENGNENHAIPYTEVYIRPLNTSSNSLIKNGAGTLTLNGSEVFISGDTTVNEGTLTVAAGGNVNTNSLRIGSATSGAVVNVEVGGTLNVWGNTTTIDSAVGPDFGTLNVMGLFNEAADLIVGQSNTGNVNVTLGGDVNVGDNLVLGELAGSTGNLTIGPNAGNSVTVANTTTIGAAGTGTVTQNGGTFTQNGGEVHFGGAAGGQGNYTLNNGTFDANTVVRIGNNGTAVNTFDQNGGSADVLRHLVLGQNAGTQGVYDISAGSLNVNSFGDATGLYIGHVGTGTFNQDGAATTTTVGRTVTIGNVGGSVGNLNLDDGSFTVNAGNLLVGNGGTGTVTQNGGTLQVNNGEVQLGNGGVGTYILNDGVFDANSVVRVGNSGAAVNTFDQNGGSADVLRHLVLGQNAGTQGVYEMSSGTLNVNSFGDAIGLYVGHVGNGTFNQTGGDVTVQNEIRVGNAGGLGAYGISGNATLDANGVVRVGNATNAGTHMFSQSGNSDVDVLSHLVVAQNNGVNARYDMDGGTLNVNSVGDTIGLYVGHVGNGTFDQTAGDANVAGNVVVGNVSPSLGVLNVSGGTFDVTGGDLIVGVGGNGTLNISGNAVVTTPDLIVAQGGGSVGLVNQTGGILNVTNPSTYDVGGAGNATVNHSNGIANVTGHMNVGTSGGTGVYTLSGTAELDFHDTSGTPGLNLAPPAPALPATQEALANPSILTIGQNGSFNFNGGVLRNVNDILVHSTNPQFTVGDNVAADNARFVIGVDGVDMNNPLTTRAITTIAANSGAADFLLNSDGTLVIDIFGPGSHGGNGEQGGILTIDPLSDSLDSDLLHVTGNATLNGTLEINLNGYEPAPFHWYDVLLADGGTLDIDNMSLVGVNFARVIDDPTDPTGVRQLLQVAVPEPASLVIWSLVGLALAGFGWRRLRM